MTIIECWYCGRDTILGEDCICDTSEAGAEDRCGYCDKPLTERETILWENHCSECVALFGSPPPR